MIDWDTRLPTHYALYPCSGEWSPQGMMGYANVIIKARFLQLWIKAWPFSEGPFLLMSQFCECLEGHRLWELCHHRAIIGVNVIYFYKTLHVIFLKAVLLQKIKVALKGLILSFSWKGLFSIKDNIRTLRYSVKCSWHKSTTKST